MKAHAGYWLRKARSGRVGELAPGHKLPAERDLASEVGVSYMTVRRAMRELRDRGLIVSVIGRGTFVASLPG